MSVLSHVSSLKKPVTRFAPSPTGDLHLGHAFAACFAAEQARQSGGQFLVRIEDIDTGRCRAEFEESIFDDLAWLGLTWDPAVMRQSERFAAYEQALAALSDQNLLYPCFCTRKEIRKEIERAGAAPHGPDGPLYPGTCRSLSHTEAQDRIGAGNSYALRLDMQAAVQHAGLLTWIDDQAGAVDADPALFGDIVLARKDSPASYHLAVTVDDHEQGVTLVTRGEDLFPSTHIHRLLQALLELPTPRYLHHKLIVGPDGKKFSKRDQSVTLKAMRQAGMTPGDIYTQFGLNPIA